MAEKADSRWRKALWISGDGQYALLAACNDEDSVTLWGNIEEAEKQKAFIDETGCGGRCTPKRHSIIDLSESP